MSNATDTLKSRRCQAGKDTPAKSLGKMGITSILSQKVVGDKIYSMKTKIKKSTKKIEISPEEWYTLNDIVRNEWFRGYTSPQKVREVIVSDKKRKDILQTIIEGRSNAKRYSMQGKNIINFLKVWEAGTYRI